MDSLDKEILKYEKRGFKTAQKRTLKHGIRVFLRKERKGFLSSGFYGIYIYYTEGDCTTESLRECLKDYSKFHEEERFDEEDRGFFICSGTLDEKLFKDLRKALIADEDARNGIKAISLSEATFGKRGEITPDFKQIIEKTRRFSPHKKPRKEKELENMLVAYLSASYPEIKTQMTYERARIDAQIGRVGIEIKYEPSASELDRLYGQVEKYLKHLDKVIVVIGNGDRESIETFQDRLERRGWSDRRVFIVSIS